VVGRDVVESSLNISPRDRNGLVTPRKRERILDANGYAWRSARLTTRDRSGNEGQTQRGSREQRGSFHMMVLLIYSRNCPFRRSSASTK
jgi:hypothetical protein